MAPEIKTVSVLCILIVDALSKLIFLIISNLTGEFFKRERREIKNRKDFLSIFTNILYLCVYM